MASNPGLLDKGRIMKNKTAILVTGVNGYIGTEIFKSLDTNKFDVYGIDKSGNGGENISIFNLNDQGKVCSFFSNTKIDCIVHAGGNSAGHYSVDFNNALKEDFLSISNMISACNGARFIFFSSSYVYSDCNSSTVSEDRVSDINLLNNFGFSKFLLEKFISRNIENHVVFRLSNVFGYGNQINLTAIKSWINEATENQEISIWGSGNRMMQYIYNKDVVSVVVKSLGNNMRGVFNLGGIDYLSIKDASAVIAKALKSRVSFDTEKGDGVTLPFMSSEKLYKQAKVSDQDFYKFNDAIEDYLKQISQKQKQ